MDLKFLNQKISRRKDSGILRSLKNTKGGIDFYSNDYLGLSKVFLHSENANPMGSTGSRLLSGNHFLLTDTEHFLADFFQTESALLFNSGYTANMAILSSLGGKDDTIIYDEKSHASIKDGARLSFARHFSFRHNSPEHLEVKLKSAKGNCFVVVESVYSMDGTEADLENLVRVCEKYKAFLIIDEAHSTGIYGEYGEGYVIEHQKQDKILARIHTFGKAMGRHGACICGPKILMDYMVNFARPFIYTTAMPPFNAIDIVQIFKYLKNNYYLKDRLKINIETFNSIANNSFLHSKFMLTNTPIQGFRLENRTKLKKLTMYLNENGFRLQPIFHPTVAEKEERIRISIHSFNTKDQIYSLVTHIEKFMNRL